jgi:hypothetical protein
MEGNLNHIKRGGRRRMKICPDSRVKEGGKLEMKSSTHLDIPVNWYLSFRVLAFP